MEKPGVPRSISTEPMPPSAGTEAQIDEKDLRLGAERGKHLAAVDDVVRAVRPARWFSDR